MNILLVHQNFPAQFKHLGPALVKAGHSVTALVLGREKLAEWHGIKIVPYKLSRGNAKEAHPWIVDVESKDPRVHKKGKSIGKNNSSNFNL